ncbi:MAG: glycosyltransferase [Collinsella sp.]
MILLGRLSRKDLAALMLQSDACCLPSRSEGFSTVLLEAAACGTPLLRRTLAECKKLHPTTSLES